MTSSAPPKFASQEEAKNALSGGASFLEDKAREQYAPEEVSVPGVFTYTVPLAKSETLVWGYFWCTTTTEILDQSVGLDTSSPIQGSQDLTPWLIGLGIVGGLALIGGAGWYFWPRGGAARSTPRPRRRARSAPADPAGGAGPAGANQFCTQCGQALTPADRFCRNCGTPVRD